MKYHKFSLCKILGHRINENPAHHWCERCKLAYEECYYPKDYYKESGITKPEIDYKEIDNIEFADVDYADYPDFSDAYIVSADYKGEPMNGWQLDRINEDHSYIHEALFDDLF